MEFAFYVFVVLCGGLLAVHAAVHGVMRAAHRRQPLERRVRIGPATCTRRGCGMVRPWTRMVPDSRGGYVCHADECHAFDDTADQVAA